MTNFSSVILILYRQRKEKWQIYGEGSNGFRIKVRFTSRGKIKLKKKLFQKLGNVNNENTKSIKIVKIKRWQTLKITKNPDRIEGTCV